MKDINIKFLTPQTAERMAERMLDELNQDELEHLIAKKLQELSPEARNRIIKTTSEPNLTVITGGSLVTLNSQVAVIQNITGSGFDPELAFKALAEFYKKTQPDDNNKSD